MKKVFVLFLCLPVISFSMSLDEAIKKSIISHPQVIIKKEELKVQENSLDIVNSGYLPTLDISYKVGPEVTKTIINQRKQADLTRQDADAKLTLNIFSGFDTVYASDNQKALILSAKDNIEDTANNIALKMTQAYIDVIKNKELYDIAKENVAVHEKYLAQIKMKVDAGVGRSSDYKQTLSRLENARSVMCLTEQNYQNSIASFQRILPLNITANKLSKPVIKKLPAKTLDELIKIAMKKNPIIKISKDDIIAAKYALNRSKSPYYPKADIVADAYWNKNVHGVSTSSSNPVVSRYDEDSGYNALLVLSYNIFNGFSDSANKQIKQHILLQKNSILTDSKRYLKAYTTIAYQTYKSTQQQLAHIQKHIQASKDTVSDYRQENDLGRRSIIDLLNIELEYNAARNKKVTTTYDNMYAYYQILAYTGKLLSEMNVVIK